MPFVWSADLDTGIEIIDQQHRRIVDYINQLEQANLAGDRDAVGHTLTELLDYTMSHFAFEEGLQEEAGYQFCKPHKRVHELFTRRVNDYISRHQLGEDIGEELYTLLKTWLFNHIKRDDADYVGSVKANMESIVNEKARSHAQEEDGGWFGRFFRRWKG